MTSARLDDVRLNDQVVANEVGRIVVVGQDAAHLGCGQKDILRLLLGEEVIDGLRIQQIKFGARARKKVRIPLGA